MSKYDEVIEVGGEIPIFEIKPLRTYRYCGLNERNHDMVLCTALKAKDKATNQWKRVRCRFLNEAGGCDYTTKEERILKEKEAKQNGEDNGND